MEGRKNMASVTTIGLGKTMEKKLYSVDILYHLEAAIRGVEIKQLEDGCKAELKAYFKQL